MSWRSIFIAGDDAWPGLGFNPAKGDLEAIDNLASDVKAVSSELNELDELITSIGKNGSAWQGEAAQRFHQKLGDLPKYLKQGGDSMGDCAKVLRGWHDQLSPWQRQAHHLESEAVTARKEADHLVHAYNKHRFSVQSLGPMPADKADHLTKELNQQRQEAEHAQDKLDGLVKEAEELYAKWKDHAQKAEQAIIKASENHPPDISFWGRIGDTLKEFTRDVGDWLAENADLLSTISAGLGTAALVLQAIPVVGNAAGGVLAIGAGVFAAGAAVGHFIQGTRGKKASWGKMGLDILGVIPGAKGVTALVKGGRALNGVKGAEAAATVARGGRMEAAGQAAQKGLRESFSQAKILRPMEQRVASAFGKPITSEKAIEKLDIYSQLSVKSLSFGNGVVHQATSH